MYLLSYDRDAELRTKAQRALMGRGGVQDRELLAKIHELKPDYTAKAHLDFETRSLLKEINGNRRQLNGESYGKSYYGKAIDSAQRFRIAHAMYLADIEFGLLDEISMSLTESVFEDFAAGAEWSFRTPNQFGDEERVSWEEFRRGFLNWHLHPAWPEDGEAIATSNELLFEFYAGRKRVNLRFVIDKLNGQASWRLRGASRFKKTHIVLVDELNTVLKDFQERLAWLKKIKRYPGLDSYELNRVRSALEIFYPKGFDLSCIQAGLSLGDEPVILDSGDARAYVVRCDRCEYPMLMEIIRRPFSDGLWTDPLATRRHVTEERVNSALSHFHRETGCSNSYGISSRTGLSLSS